MSEPISLSTPPPVILNRIVRNYLIAKAKTKSSVKWDSFSNENGEIQWDSIPKPQLASFNEAKNKLAESLFLEFRSRRDQAFVDHFAATFFSVTQRLSDADRLELSNMLVASERRDDLKTLTLLALSANS
jgi:CRISPR-associated protein Cmx8